MTIDCLHSLATLLLQHVQERTCAHTNAVAHHVFYWIVSHFLLSEAYPPSLPLPSCSPPILSSRLPSSTSFCHSPAPISQSLSSLFFSSALLLRLPLFLQFLSSIRLIIHLLFASSSSPVFVVLHWSSSLGCRPVWVRGRL